MNNTELLLFELDLLLEKLKSLMLNLNNLSDEKLPINKKRGESN